MHHRGLAYAIITYIFWGLSPLYWIAFKNFTTFEVLSHRILWSLCFTLLILAFRKQFNLPKLLRQARVLRVYVISAVLLAINWFVYIFAVANGYVLESSLGYFITPLVNVFLGYIVLKERLRPWQWVAIILCCIGVIYRTISYGSLPIIALTLAITFGFYGLIRKQAPLDAIEGLAIENSLMVLPALGFILFLMLHGSGHFFGNGLETKLASNLGNGHLNPLLFISAGFYTAVPLIAFAAAAKRLTLGVVGMLMYLNPTLQFLCGRFVFNEAFDQSGLIAFSIIWSALILFSAESFFYSKRNPKIISASL